MENPVFKLEKVVHTCAEELQDFEGPLDLILFLLGKNRMEIAEISISLICDQYLEWLQQRQQMDLEVASEFVVMASYLVYIKTRMLLSMEDEEAQSEMDALIQSLEERRRSEDYSRIKAAASRLEELGEFGRNILTREPETEGERVYEYSQNPEELLSALRELRSRTEWMLPPARNVFQELIQREPYPVESKTQELLQRLQTSGSVRFLSLFCESRSRSEIVATFLAILELCRSNALYLTETDMGITVHQGVSPPGPPPTFS